MKRVLLVSLLLASCGARATTPTTPILDATEREVSGVTVVARPRPGSGHVVGALFVRARPEHALLTTVAALVIEARSGGVLTARATADGATLRGVVTRDALPELVNALAAALAARDVTSDEVAQALDRVRARRAGRAADDRARATRDAIAALLGPGLDPLGTIDDEAALTSASVSSFLASHFGAERALVAVVGDASGEEVEAAVSRAFERAPHVPLDVVPLAAPTTGVVVEASEHDVLAIARPTVDLAAAERARSWLSWADPTADVAAFSLRGVPMIVAVHEGPLDDAPRSFARMRALTALDEPPGPTAAPDAEHELVGVGDAWLARGRRGSDRTVAIGVGVTTRGGDEDDAAQTAAVRARLLATLDEAMPTRASSTIDATHADVVLASGVRVRVRRTAAATLTLVIGLDGGASFDPPGEHGRAALLTALLAQSCEPDAESTWVDARSLGLGLVGDRDALERTVARGVDCVRRALRDAARSDLRADVIASLDDDARARAWSAAAIAPSTPGLVAPRGSATGIAASSGLDAALADALAPSRTTFVVVGDVEPAHAVDVIEALSSEVGAAERGVPAPRLGAVATSDVFVTDPAALAPEVIVTLRTDVGASDIAARATARALATALREAGVSVRFWLGDAGLGASFVAVGVRGDDATLDALPTRIGGRLAAIASSADLDLAARDEARDAALGSPLELARSLVHAPETADAAAVVRGLVAAAPRFVMVRPSAGPLRPPRRR